MEHFWPIIWVVVIIAVVVYVVVLVDVLTDLFRATTFGGWQKGAWIGLLIVMPCLTASMVIIAAG